MMKNCKKCLYHQMCPFNISVTGTAAERCKTYEDTADYVKVVRCKDCANRNEKRWCKIQARYTHESEYCSDGKRGESNE